MLVSFLFFYMPRTGGIYLQICINIRSINLLVVRDHNCVSRQALHLIISASVSARSFLICSKNPVHNCKNSDLLTSFSFTAQCAIIEVKELGSWNELEKFRLRWDIIEIGTSDKTVVVGTEAFDIIHSSTFVSRFLLFSISTPFLS